MAKLMFTHLCGEANVREPVKCMQRTNKTLSVSYIVITKCARGLKKFCIEGVCLEKQIGKYFNKAAVS